MKNREIRNKIRRTALISIAICFVVYVIIIAAGINITESAVSFSGFVALHNHCAAYYMLDIVFAGSFIACYLLSRRYYTRIEEANDRCESQIARKEEIQAFIDKLKTNEFDVELKELDETDKLGKSLVELKSHLIKNREEEERRHKEDEQRSWATEGLAEFAEILRKDNDDMEKLSFSIISSLVKYLGANQAGFFLLNDDEEEKRYFELTACYAFERKKFFKKEIAWAEGLIGMCALEMDYIFMTDVPEDYVNITSGLGDGNPKCLLLVPLVVNDEIHGVIEIASFQVFENYKIEFVKKLAESIASTISSVKVNIRTSRLLRESQEQAERLAQQEEEMRQNMEELRATQEEAARQGEEFKNFTNAVNHTLIRSEYDLDGKLLYGNTKFLEKLEYTENKEIEGRHITAFIDEKDRKWFDDIWQRLSEGGRHFSGDMKHITKNGNEVWTKATYVCVRNSKDGRIEKILFLGVDITEQKKRDLDFEGQIAALDLSSLKVSYAPDGTVLEANKKFMEIFGYASFKELSGKTVFDVIKNGDPKEIKKIWKALNEGKPFEGQMPVYLPDNTEIWLQTTYTPVYDMYGNISKIVLIANDITLQKQMELETKKQADMLKSQEEQLRKASEELSEKLDKTRKEVQEQFKTIEKVKIRNEKTLEGALDAIVTIDHDGIVRFFNKAAEELWGIKRKEIIGENVKNLFSDDTEKHDEFIQRYIDPAKEKMVGIRKEVRITDKSGDEKPVLILLSEAKVDNEQTYTAFIQNVEVELF